MRHLILAGAFLSAVPAPAGAYQQPAVNLGATSFLDGGGAPPGFYLVEYVQRIDGRKALDKDGNRIPGGARIGVLANIHQFYWLTNKKVAGANLGLDLLVPVVAPGATGKLGALPLSAGRPGMGDILFGPALQWYGTLLGAPYFYRLELNLFLPTGRYDAAVAANPGFNIRTWEAYYAATWMPSPVWEFSARLNYSMHSENPDTKMRPGQLFHMNLSASRAVAPKARVGAAGYLLRQTTADEAGGAARPGSQERAFAAGPAVLIRSGDTLLLFSHLEEFAVRNRFAGSRSTLQAILKF